MRSVKQILDAKPAQVITVPRETSVLEVIRLMAERHIGSVLVMNNHELIGIATERDYARKVILQGRSSADTPVSAIMTSPVITVTPEQRATACMRIMTDKRIRHLPVVDDGQVIGLISIGDLLKIVIEDQRHEIEQLQQYIAS